MKDLLQDGELDFDKLVFVFKAGWWLIVAERMDECDNTNGLVVWNLIKFLVDESILLFLVPRVLNDWQKVGLEDADLLVKWLDQECGVEGFRFKDDTKEICLIAVWKVLEQVLDVADVPRVLKPQKILFEQFLLRRAVQLLTYQVNRGRLEQIRQSLHRKVIYVDWLL